MTDIETANLFLVPSSVLVGALGVATKEGLKTGVSFLGLVVGGLWVVSAFDAAVSVSPLRDKLLPVLPIMFEVAWIISAVYHARKFMKSKE